MKHENPNVRGGRVGIVTCRELPEPDFDEDVLREALGAAELEPAMIAWDDDASDPAAFDACLLRSCWNYYEDVERFLAWIDRADAVTRLIHPAPIVRWNIDKRYLAELDRAGLPVVPTAWVARGASTTLADVLGEHGWSDVVVKPAISAGSYRTRRLAGASADGEEFLRELARDGDVMIQPFIASVATHGERAMVWIDGAFTHVIEKRARFSGDDEQASEALEPTDEELAIGERTLEAARAALGCELSYARVDLMRDDDGGAILSELELLEPSLFFVQSPSALERFVTMTAKAVAETRTESGPSA